MKLFSKFKKKKTTENEAEQLHMELEKEKQKLQNIKDRAEKIRSEIPTTPNKNIGIMADNNTKGERLEREGLFDEAITCYENNVKICADTPFTYQRLAALYHYKKDFQAEKTTLEKGLEYCKNNPNPSNIESMERSLNNVNQFLETGNWKYDCLPVEPVTSHYEIQEAKRILKSEDKEKGILMLEKIMNDDSYNNTVYYTLYQTYKKDKRYDDCIRVCKKAIEVLGFFSNDRKSKWDGYLDKSIQLKEKL